MRKVRGAGSLLYIRLRYVSRGVSLSDVVTGCAVYARGSARVGVGAGLRGGEAENKTGIGIVVGNWDGDRNRGSERIVIVVVVVR